MSGFMLTRPKMRLCVAVSTSWSSTRPIKQSQRVSNRKSRELLLFLYPLWIHRGTELTGDTYPCAIVLWLGCPQATKPPSRCGAMNLTAITSNLPLRLLTDPVLLRCSYSKTNLHKHAHILYMLTQTWAHIQNILSLLWPEVVIYTAEICFFSRTGSSGFGTVVP